MQALNSTIQVAKAELMQLHFHDQSQPGLDEMPKNIMQDQLHVQIQGSERKVLPCTALPVLIVLAYEAS